MGRHWVPPHPRTSLPLPLLQVTDGEQSEHGGEEYVLKTERVDLYISAGGQLRTGRARGNWNCG